MSEQLRVGFGRANITPDCSVGIGGYSDDETRISEGVAMDLFFTCIAMSEAEETILLFSVDSLSVYRGLADLLRKRLTAAVNIPAEKIFFTATHCHNAPSNYVFNDATAHYREMFLDGALEAAKQALADRAPAVPYGAKKIVPGMTFVRHYLTANGTYFGSNFGSLKDNPPVAHAAEPDDQMVLVKFAREGKKDILLVNWQSHADRSKEIGFHLIAPSWIGPMREKLEKDSGMHMAYIAGGSGDLVPDSKLPELRHGLTWREYGEKMAEIACQSLNQLKVVEGTGIKTTRVIFNAEIDHSWDNMIEQANEVYDLWKSTDKPTGDALGKTYGFTSSYQARAIRTRYKMEKTGELELNAFRVGGLGFATNTYEMFGTSCRFVKDNSPYEITMVCCGNSSYIPSLHAFNYRCYEADTGFYAKGTAEVLAQKQVDMLKDVK